ncbi:MAG: hypothetical protein AAF827_19410 [Cyanobacteria bacterium P01_D01_bin.6]
MSGCYRVIILHDLEPLNKAMLILAELVEAKNDATLLELAELLAERTQLSVSPATVS